ncbi:chemotaxis protein CheB [Isoalcanivorax beigongshangi]|uniref:protein-glutamate methylesterase n=1 Tax=Isoalcanivorax beigongshangi TaxID=3238810 RepID=A0ABV4AD20_9GAMM
MTPAPRIGVIADSRRQGQALAHTIGELGYRVAFAAAPDALPVDWLQQPPALLVVELEDGTSDHGFLAWLLDQVQMPILFGDGSAPATIAPDYPRWRRRLAHKLNAYLGPPAGRHHAPLPVETGLQVWLLAASLGGPAAVKLFLDCLPAGLPVAFVLAQHIDGHALELLPRVLTRDNSYQCEVARPGSRLAPGRVLLAPVQSALQFDSEGTVQWTHQPWQGAYSPSIDQLMAALADTFGAAAGALVFSGMGADGAVGALALAAAGGQVWAQSADSCAISSQPDAARASGVVTFTGAPEQLAAQLVAWNRQRLHRAGVDG